LSKSTERRRPGILITGACALALTLLVQVSGFFGHRHRELPHVDHHPAIKRVLAIPGILRARWEKVFAARLPLLGRLFVKAQKELESGLSFAGKLARKVIRRDPGS